jgi:hypothetical protein
MVSYRYIDSKQALGAGLAMGTLIWNTRTWNKEPVECCLSFATVNVSRVNHNAPEAGFLRRTMLRVGLLE